MDIRLVVKRVLITLAVIVAILFPVSALLAHGGTRGHVEQSKIRTIPIP